MIQPIEQINGHWVVFGLGNFISNMPTGPKWPASSQDGVIVTITVTRAADGHITVEQPRAIPTWVDRDHGFVIRPVLADLADPSTPQATKRQLQASLERTSEVIGAYVAG